MENRQPPLNGEPNLTIFTGSHILSSRQRCQTGVIWEMLVKGEIIMGDLYNRAKVNVGIISGNTDTLKIIESCFKTCQHISSTHTFTDTAVALSNLNNKSVNCICVDLESLGPNPSVKFIETVRRVYFQVPVCLLGTNSYLKTFPEMSEHWKRKFEHYYKIPTDLKIPEACTVAAIVSELFLADQVKALVISPYMTLYGKFAPTSSWYHRFFSKDSIQAAVLAVVLAFLLNLIAGTFNKPPTNIPSEKQVKSTNLRMENAATNIPR